MEERDLSLISSLTPYNPELAALMREHGKLERELTGLVGRRFLSEREQREVKFLKRRKLRGRDRIEAILSRHR
ncbi:MAG TPA: DUF465 domain-containing protein [Myxococcota bacterium]|nr:DUF465 domain-containing protein [Myxococcota bacterium]